MSLLRTAIVEQVAYITAMPELEGMHPESVTIENSPDWSAKLATKSGKKAFWKLPRRLYLITFVMRWRSTSSPRQSPWRVHSALAWLVAILSADHRDAQTHELKLCVVARVECDGLSLGARPYYRRNPVALMNQSEPDRLRRHVFLRGFLLRYKRNQTHRRGGG